MTFWRFFSPKPFIFKCTSWGTTKVPRHCERGITVLQYFLKQDGILNDFFLYSIISKGFGRLFSFGSNKYGQLGVGDFRERAGLNLIQSNLLGKNVTNGLKISLQCVEYYLLHVDCLIRAEQVDTEGNCQLWLRVLVAVVYIQVDCKLLLFGCDKKNDS